MARIVGINLPDEKRIDYALTLVYGIGWANVKEILKQANVDASIRVKNLSEEEMKRIQTVVEKFTKVEGDLREEISNNIKRLREIGSYRGLRHVRNLPSRGQRTKSNARTKRGKRKTVGALKKEDAVKLQAAAQKK
jgi:small subunit ribosomal protein S13